MLVTWILFNDTIGDIDLGLRDREQFVYALDVVLSTSPHLLGSQVVEDGGSTSLTHDVKIAVPQMAELYATLGPYL